MFERADSRGFGAGKPGSHGRFDGIFRVGWVVSDRPVSSVAIPWDRLEPEYALGNCPDPVIDIYERWSPVSRESSAIQVRDDLHGPAELAHDVLV